MSHEGHQEVDLDTIQHLGLTALALKEETDDGNKTDCA